RGPVQARQGSGISYEVFFFGRYFDGHLVSIESRSATKTPFSRRPVTRMCFHVPNSGPLSPWYTTDTVWKVLPPMSRILKRSPPGAYEFPLIGPITVPTIWTLPTWFVSWLGFSVAVPLPAIAVYSRKIASAPATESATIRRAGLRVTR